MKQKLLSILLFCMCALTGYAAINYNLQQSFEDGVIPSDWSQEYISSNQTDWIVDTISSNPNGAADGDYRAAMRNLSTNEAIITKLITPPMNLMNIEPQLTFAYALPKRANLFSDTLKVYYRPSASDPWVYMFTYGEAQNAWQQVVLQDLPAGCQSAYCQFAFEAKLAGGLGVVLDDIKVFPISQCLPAAFDMGNTAIGADYADIFFTGDLNETFELLVTTEPVQDFEAYSLNQPSQPESVIYHQDGILASEGFVPVEPLTPQTMYYAYLRSTCRDNETGYSEWVSYAFKTPCLATEVAVAQPWIEDFESFTNGYNGSTPSYSYNSLDYALSAGCWTNEHLEGNGAYLFSIFDPTSPLDGNATKQLYLPDMTSGTMTLLSLPNFAFEEPEAYAFSLDVYRSTSGSSYPQEGIRVFASLKSEFSEETAVELGFISRNCSVADGDVVKAESTTGWYNYEFIIPLGGEVYIYLRGESQYGAYTCMDNFKVRKLPACKPIKKIEASNIQTNEATISITASNASQYELIVSYAEINPDSVSSVDPSLIAYSQTVSQTSVQVPQLVPSTQYYMYVRGLCPGEAPSVWTSGSFLTKCDAMDVTSEEPWIETFENYPTSTNAVGFDGLCWKNIRSVIAGTTSVAYRYHITNTTMVGNATKKMCLPDMAAGNMALLTLPAVNVDEANEYAFSLDILRNATSYPTEGIRIFVSLTDTIDSISAVELAFIPRKYAEAGVNVPAEEASAWYNYEFIIPIAGKVYIHLQGESQYGAATYMDNFKIRKFPNCRDLDKVAISAKGTHSVGFTVSIAKDAPQYQLVLSKKSINPDNFATDTNVIHMGIYDDKLISFDSEQLMQPNTRYYAYLRSYCGANDQGAWYREVQFKTLCEPIALESFGVETFDAADATDCWEMGVLNEGTTSAIVHKRDSNAAYGAHLYLARTSAAVDGDDAPYAVSPKLEFEDGEDIRNYQVVFDAASSRNVPTNLRRLSVHVTIDPLDMSTSRPIKILTVPLASNAQGEQTFTISFAGYTGIRGVYGQYVVFQAEEAASHDSTNYIVIDNIRFEPASSCPQLVETAISATTLHGASMSWEDAEAPAYQVIVLPQAVQQPESIEGAVFSDIVTTNSAELSGLDASTTYYAYVRAICAEGDTAQWSNPVAFKTNQGIPYNEAFATALYPQGWSTYSGAFGADSTDISELSAPHATYNWELISSGTPEGMQGFVARSYIYYTNGYNSWMVSPVIDLADATADQFLRLTFKAARANYSTYDGVTAPTTVSGYKFYVIISEDGGTTWKDANATKWRTDGQGDYDYNAIAQAASSYQIGLTKYAGKKIKIAFYTESNSAPSYHNYLFVDSIKVETYEAVCMGVRKLAVEATADSAYVSWEIEGTPAKTILVLSDSANFAHVVDSVVVENAFTYSFADLAPATTYYVRAMQADCENAEWVSNSFVTECVPFAQFPWTENFDEYPAGNFNGLCFTNEHIAGASTYVFNVYTTALGGNSTPMLQLPDMNAGNQTLLTLPTFAIPQADAYQFSLDVYRSETYSTKLTEGISIFINTDGSLNDTLAFIPRVYSAAGLGVGAEATTGWYTYTFNIPVAGNVYIMLRGESQYGSATYLDNLKVRALPACSNLSGVIAVDSIAQDAAAIRFEGTGAPMYQVIVSTKFYEDTEAITPESLTPEDTAAVAYADIITDTAFVATDLQPATQYYVYIRAVCDPLHMSDWAGTSFTTSCGIVASFPWAEDFNSLTSGIPPCWDNSEGTTTASYKWNYYATGREGKGLRFNSYTNSNGNTNILALPPMILSQDMALSFYWKNPEGGEGAVLISTDGGATKTVLENQLTGISAWTQFEIDLSAYTGDTVNIYFSGTSNYGDGDAYLYLDDILVKALPSCKKLTDIAINAIGTDSAVVVFTDSINNAGLYHLIVADAALDFSAALSAQDSAHIVVDDSTLQASPAVLRGLVPASDYFVYLAARCDEVQSDWSSAVRFATACVPVANLPWAEDFENIATGTLAEHCWLNYHNAGSGTTVATVSSTTYSNGSTHTLYMPYLATSNKVLVATPQIVIPEPNEYEFRLDVYRNATSYAAEGLRIYASTSDTIDSIAAVELAFISRKYAEADSIHGVPAENATGWYTYTFPISLAGEVRIIMQYEGAGGEGMYTDNLLLRHVPACADMKGIMVKDITGESATLQLDSVARFYQLVVAKKAINPDTLELVPDLDLAFSGNIMLDENHEFPMEHLFQGRTSYYVYLRTLCGDNEAGAWSKAVTFTTSCASIVIEANAPWTEDFNSLTSGIPECWDNEEGTTTTATSKWNYYATGHEGKGLRFNSYTNSNGNTNILALPPMILSQDMALSFYWKNPTGGEGAVLISTDGGATRTVLENQLTGISAWTQFEIDLSAYTGNTVNIYFSGTSNYGNGDAYLYLDDILVKALPTCRDIKDVKVSEIGTASAKVDFSNVKAEAYQLILATESIDPSYIDSLNGLDPSKVIRVDLIDTTAIAYDSLAPSTTYYGYVRGICGDAETSGWKSYSFMTACIASIPFLENFDSNDNHKHLGDGLWIPGCFNEIYSDNAYYAAVDNEDSLQTSSYSYFYAYSGNSALHISSSSANPVCVILPVMDVPLDSLQISFKARAMYAAETNLTQEQTVYSYASSSYAHSITVGTITDPQDLSTFQLLETYPLTEYATAPASLSEDPNNFWETVTVYLQGGASGKYIALLSSFNKANEVWIDDIEVSYAPDCTAPSGIVASPSDNKVDLVWAGSADEYRIALGLAGFNPDTVSAVYVTDSLYYTLDNLQPSTDYEIYIMSGCFSEGGIIYSPWSRVCAFRTACAPIVQFPWSEDFEEYTAGSGTNGSVPAPECWASLNAESGPYAYVHSSSTYNYIGSGDQYLFFNGSGGSVSKLAHFILPRMESLNSLQIRFKYAFEGTSSGDFIIGYMTDVTNQNSFHAIETISHNVTVKTAYQSAWISMESVPDSLLGKARIAIRYAGTSNWYATVDDIEVQPLPTCRNVTDLAVSQVSANSAKVSFSASNTPYYQIAVTSVAINPDSLASVADSIVIFREDSLIVTESVVNGLTAKSTYYVYLRSLCSSDDMSEWATASFTTPCEAIAEFPWSEDFDALTAGIPDCWDNSEGTTTTASYNWNYYATGHEGKCVRFDSYYNSTGKTNVLATPIISLPQEPMILSFYWKNPAGGAGEVLIAADGDTARTVLENQLTEISDWTKFEIDLSLYAGENVTIYFSGTSNCGYGDAYLYLDDVAIKRIPTCRDIKGIEAIELTENSATISYLSSGAANYQVLVASAPVSIDSLSAIDSTKIVFNDAQLVDTFALVSGLNANTAYYAYVRGLCGNEQSEWSSPVAFRTECVIVSALPWAEDFEDADNRQPIAAGSSYKIPYCWQEGHNSTSYSSHLETNSTYYTYARSGESALCMYSSSTYSTYVLLPQMAFADDVVAQLSFYARSVYQGSSSFTNYSSSYYAHSVKVGLVSDPNDISSFELLKEVTLHEYASATEAAAAANLCWENIKITLPALGGRYLALVSDFDKTNYIYIDDIAISEYNATCEGIENVYVSNVSAMGADVLFHFVGDSVRNARIALSAEAELNLDNALLIDTILSDTVYSIHASLNYSTTYYVFVQQICGADGESGWTRASFNTPYGVRYAPIFSSTTLPGDWTIASGLVDGVLAGTTQLTPASSGWNLVAGDTIIGATHFRGEIWSTSFKYWAITPAIDLTSNMGDGLLLNFDAGLVPYSEYFRSKRNDGTDDRFAVLVTTDEGASWIKVAEWNNAGTGDYVYNDVPENGQSYHLDMSRFGGQIVRIAFYGESTEGNADNYFHFGNIVLDRVAAVTYSGHVCEGSDYNGAADGNPFNIAADQYVRGMNVFSEFRPAEDDLDIDSMLILNLMVDTAVYHDYYAVLCEGEHYSNYGWEFDAELNMSDKAFFLQTVNGCDSVVRLVITVNPKQTVHIYDSVAIGDAYIWQGEEIYTAGTYPFNTHSVVTGCDSTAVLHLSTYIPTDLGAAYANKLMLTPNPVEVGQPVQVLNDFSAAELADAKIEVFSASGMLLYSAHGAAQPLIIPGMSVSGLHYVRITVADKVYNSPLLVK